MSEMTATRMARAAGGIATITLAAGLWLAAAWLLWRTRVPDDLRLPRLDPRDYFSAAALRRTARHDGFLRIDFLLALMAQLGGIALVAARAERIEARLRGGTLLRGLELALVAGAAGWLARFPFGLAAQWWERRYGLSRESYG